MDKREGGRGRRMLPPTSQVQGAAPFSSNFAVDNLPSIFGPFCASSAFWRPNHLLRCTTCVPPPPPSSAEGRPQLLPDGPSAQVGWTRPPPASQPVLLQLATKACGASALPHCTLPHLIQHRGGDHARPLLPLASCIVTAAKVQSPPDNTSN